MKEKALTFLYIVLSLGIFEVTTSLRNRGEGVCIIYKKKVYKSAYLFFRKIIEKSLDLYTIFTVPLGVD